MVSRRRFLAIGGLGALAARLLGTERPAVSAPEVGQVIVLGAVRKGDLLVRPHGRQQSHQLVMSADTWRALRRSGIHV